MLELEEARERILAAIELLPVESVSLTDSAERFLAEDFIAPINLPRFDNSAMDGYAVRSEDLKGATASAPVSLKVVTEIPAGAPDRKEIGRGGCARIFTGSPLPGGADAVVMQEDVGRTEALASFREPVKPWENVRLAGEDVKAGARVLEAGERIDAARIGLLGALGAGKVSVRRRPVAGLLATGNELREPGEQLAPGQIYESNRALVAELARKAGAIPVMFPVVPDTLEGTRAALREAFDRCDFVITSGGVSVGEHDFVKEALRGIGGRMEFWRVSIRPGKPFVFGEWSTKRLFGLPGNPVSALVTALLLVRPALLRAQGARQAALPTHPGIAGDEFRNATERRHYMRVRVDGEGKAHLSGLQASHAVGSLAAANGLVEVPAGAVIKPGERISVIRFSW